MKIDFCLLINDLRHGSILVERQDCPELEFDAMGICKTCRSRPANKPLAVVELGNCITRDDVEVALLYRYAAIVRLGWDHEPLDISSQGIDRARAYFRNGDFTRRLSFLGLKPTP